MPNYPQSVKIIEVGPRDGLQNESEIISTSDKLVFIEKLIASGLKNIEVSSFVHPEKVPQLKDAKEIISGLKEYPGLVYSALVPNIQGLERAKESGIKRISVFTSASETFTKKNINMTIKESLDTFKSIAEGAKKNNISVRGYISTCFICPYEGDIAKEKVLDITKALLELGVDEVSLGDTIGAASPKDVFETVGHVLNKVSKENIALHFHDTYGTALANVVAGLELGISTFDSSAGGLGGCPYAPGASGNLATEDILYLLNRMNIETGVNLGKLAEASFFMQKILGRTLPSKQLKRLSVKAVHE